MGVTDLAFKSPEHVARRERKQERERKRERESEECAARSLSFCQLNIGAQFYAMYVQLFKVQSLSQSPFFSFSETCNFYWEIAHNLKTTTLLTFSQSNRKCFFMPPARASV